MNVLHTPVSSYTGSHPTFASASAGRSRPIRQLPNIPAIRPPATASSTAAIRAAPLMAADIGTDTVWLLVGLTGAQTFVAGALVDEGRGQRRRYRVDDRHPGESEADADGGTEQADGE